MLCRSMLYKEYSTDVAFDPHKNAISYNNRVYHYYSYLSESTVVLSI